MSDDSAVRAAHEIKEFFIERDLFARHCGIELLEVGPGTAVARMALGEQHLNGLRMAHGGAIFTLADYTFAAASNSRGQAAVAVSVTISFVKAAGSGVLRAEAREVSLSSRLGVYMIEVRDDAGELVAVFQGTAYRKSMLLPFG
ncbi:MAG: hotdog fold thioesterase [Candidatus Sumerlaeaceae bacterium]|nr:hotdog fold thioesterase [Candidatus Sumerlaeaceae bacterium]